MFELDSYYATHTPKNGRFFTVAIDGRGGSGKSTLLDHLSRQSAGVFLHGDDYFEAIDDPVEWGAFNDDRFIQEVIGPLRSGDRFRHRPYDWREHQPVDAGWRSPHPAFVLERCFCLRPEFDLDWDLTIWVDLERDACLSRGLERDASQPNVAAGWRAWQKREDAYIATYNPAAVADVVVRGDQPFASQIV